jgi:C2 domain/Ferlin C-terminus
MGLSQPLLGTFYIKLGDILQDKKANESHYESYLEHSNVNPFRNSYDDVNYIDNLLDAGVARRPTSENIIFYRKSSVYPENKKLSEIAEVPEVDPVASIVTEIRKEPQFEEDDRVRRKVEVNRPDESLYQAIGYNRDPDDGLKHYRYYINNPLEETEYIGKSPFNIYEIMRGQSRGLDSVLDSVDKFDEKGQKTNSRCVGKFKGVIRVVNEDAGPKKQKTLKIVGVDGQEEPDEEEEEKKFFKVLTKQLLVRTECVIRVYVLNCIDLAQRDADSPSDPYIRMKIAKNKINDRKNYQEDNANPDIYKHYDLTTFLPGDSILEIQLWDHDDILPDSKIGDTIIDLEDRYFSYKWNKYSEKPIETRPLYMKSSRQPQGYIRMWLEIHPSKERPPPIDITPKPPLVFEARLIIWKSERVPTSAIEGLSDLYVRAWVNKETPKETDTHYRCQGGTGSWNWRIKFNVNIDGKSPYELMLQLWDRDFFSSNAFIGDASVNFTDIAKEAWENNTRVQKKGNSDFQDRLARKDTQKFWVDFKCSDKNGKENKAGRVQISFELVPEARAKACPVGEGRNEPNIDPPLPKPDGRMEWTLNPIKMMSQMCGTEIRTRLCMYISMALCLVVLILMFPMIVSNAITNIIF